jgi:hypothetical protein
MPVILKVTQSNASTDMNGLASVTATGGGFSPPVEVDVAVSAGTGAYIDDPLLMFPPPLNGIAMSGEGSPAVPHPISTPISRQVKRQRFRIRNLDSVVRPARGSKRDAVTRR